MVLKGVWGLTPGACLCAGDNFYPNSLASPNDALFQQSFMDVYTAESLQIPWHAVLGNHGAPSVVV